MNTLNNIGVFILGIVCAWVINYLADVLPIRRQLVKPLCPDCMAEKSWKDFFFFKPCSSCKKTDGARKWLLLILGPAASLALWHLPNQRLGFWLGVLVITYFGLIVVIDLEYRLILFPVSIVGLLIGMSIGVLIHGFLPTIFGGAAGFLAMLALYGLGELFAKGLSRLRGQPVEEVTLGFGDVTLSGVLGCILGWPGIIAGLVIAILLGGAASILIIVWQLIARKYKPLVAIPYAPFLILGASILLFR